MNFVVALGWRKRQIHDKRKERTIQANPRLVLLSSIEYQQPKLPHHARQNY